MKRLVRSASGRQIYGQKWQNSTGEGSHDTDAGATTESTEIAQANSDTDAGNTTPIPVPTSPPHLFTAVLGRRKGSRSCRQSMYRAALEGDWVAAEMLLHQDPSLLCNAITDRGDRALHVAVAMKHEKFVQELVQRMSPYDLEKLHDGHGYTACCYAAIAGTVDIANILMKKKQNLCTARDRSNVTPLQKAASHGKAAMAKRFLRSANVESLSEDEWFNLLLVTIKRKSYDVALKILEKNGRTATMTNKEGTALHLLARQQISLMPTNFRLLAVKLWAEIQKFGEDDVAAMMKTPPILHDAAKTGNAELITMLTRAYPDLIWHSDSNGYTIFHIAVIYKQESVFGLIHQIGAMKDLIAMTQDKNGNNILHLAGRLSPPERRTVVPRSILQTQREIRWFEKLERTVPPSCREMTNKDGLTPEKLFTQEHKMMLEECTTWARNTVDSCLLISTIMLTVVFAAAFTVPGGYNSETGRPILISKSSWFTVFVLSEAATLFTSIQAILQFWTMMTVKIESKRFVSQLPTKLTIGLSCLLLSFVGTLTVILSAYFLIYVKGRGWAGWLAGTVILIVYAIILLQTGQLFYQHRTAVRIQAVLSAKLSGRGGPSLFSQHTSKIRSLLQQSHLQ